MLNAVGAISILVGSNYGVRRSYARKKENPHQNQEKHQRHSKVVARYSTAVTKVTPIETPKKNMIDASICTIALQRAQYTLFIKQFISKVLCLVSSSSSSNTPFLLSFEPPPPPHPHRVLFVRLNTNINK